MLGTAGAISGFNLSHEEPFNVVKVVKLYFPETYLSGERKFGDLPSEVVQKSLYRVGFKLELITR